MNIITVIPIKQGVKKTLTYFSRLCPTLGSLVSVPIHKKEVPALVIEATDLRNYKSALKLAAFSLRKIGVFKGEPIWPEYFFRAAKRASSYFAAPLGNVLASFLPKILLTESASLYKEEVMEKKGNFRPEKLVLQIPLEERLSFYKTYIRQAFAQNESVIFCLPKISDIDFFKSHLAAGIEQYVFSLHSNIGEKKFIEIYNKACALTHPVVILITPNFLSLPRHDLASIIIEKESDENYQNRQCFDSRVFAELVAEEARIKIIFADTLLRLETIWRHDQGEFSELLPLNFRLPSVIETVLPKKGGIFSDEIKEIIEKAKGSQIFLFALRKGLATQTICHDCGKTLLCKNCLKPLVLHEKTKRIYICHTCRREERSETLCPNCQSWNLITLGIGIDKVVEEVKREFPNRPIFTNEKKFLETPGGILIGGQETLSKLNKKVDFSAVVSFETLWHIPEFQMTEKAVHLMIELLEHTRKKLLIQTSQKIPLENNLLEFIKSELELRKKYDYPPFVRLVEIKIKNLNLLEKISPEFESWQPELWVEPKNITLTFRVPKEKWPDDPSLALFKEKLLHLPPGAEVKVL